MRQTTGPNVKRREAVWGDPHNEGEVRSDKWMEGSVNRTISAKRKRKYAS
jgi:hypothetical protein